MHLFTINFLTFFFFCDFIKDKPCGVFVFEDLLLNEEKKEL